MPPCIDRATSTDMIDVALNVKKATGKPSLLKQM